MQCQKMGRNAYSLRELSIIVSREAGTSVFSAFLMQKEKKKRFIVYLKMSLSIDMFQISPIWRNSILNLSARRLICSIAGKILHS